MPVKKVSFVPPHDFEVQSLERTATAVAMVPIASPRGAYSFAGHVVVELVDGTKEASIVEVNPLTGRLRLQTLGRPPVAPAGGGEAAP